MKPFEFGRRAVGICVIAVTVGCGSGETAITGVTGDSGVATKLVLPDTIRVALFDSLHIPYQATDAANHTVVGTVAVVSAGGLVDAGPTKKPVASLPGVAQLDVSLDKATASATLVVGPPKTLSTFPDTVGLLVGAAPRQLHARAPWAGCNADAACLANCLVGPTCDGYGDATADVTSWSTSDPAVVTVDAHGRVSATGLGHARVTATIASTGSTPLTAGVEVFTYGFSPALALDQIEVGGSGDACALTHDQRAVCTTSTFFFVGGPYDLYDFDFTPWPSGFGSTAPTDKCLQIYPGNPYYPTSYKNVRCTQIPMLVDGDHHFTSLAVNANDEACGLDTGGATWCWGVQPVLQSSVPPLTALTAWGHSFCGLDAAGAALCFTRDSATRSVPGGHRFASLASGNGNCALDGAGAAWCWADSVSTSETTPVQAQTPAPLTSIAMSNNRACGLDTTGHVFCWAVVTGVGESSPASDQTFTAVAVGYRTGCGLTAAGTISCWDDAGFGTKPSGPAGSDWVRIFSGSGYYLCAISRTGRTTCWPGLDLTLERDIPLGG